MMIFPGLVLCVRKIFFPRIPGEGFHHKNNNTYTPKIYWEFIIIHIQTDDVTSQIYLFFLFFYKRVDKKKIEEKIFIFLLLLLLFILSYI